MMSSTLSTSTANWMADSAFRSEDTTMLATLRCTNTSPGSRPVIWFAGTRLSEQPIHMYLGVCCFTRPVKNPGHSRSIRAAQARLCTNRSSIDEVMGFAGWLRGLPAGGARGGGSTGFGKQLAADQHAADLAGAGADLIELGIAPQAAQRVVVDVAIAAMDLQTFAGHPGGLLGAPQDCAGAVLAHLAHMPGAE